MQTVINGILTGFEVVGKKNGENLLILHGWGRNLQDWIPTASILASHFRVTLLDLPGFGGSSFPQKSWRTHDYALFVVKFMKDIKIKKPVLLGHSFGGRIGIVLGTKKNLLKKLILVDSAGLEKRGLHTLVAIALFNSLGRLLPETVRENLKARLGSQDYTLAGHMRGILNKVVNENLRQLLPKIKTPTLIIWGERDQNQNIKYAKILRSEIKNSKLRIVWETGHSPHLENPKDFLAVLKEELI